MFCEKLPFDSLCSNESCIFHVRFLCIKNIPCKALDSGKNGIWNGSQMIWDSFQTSVIIAENLHFYVYETLVAYAGVCMRTHALAHLRKVLPKCVG